MATTYFLAQTGERVKTYDLHTVFYPEYAHYDNTGNLIPNIYDCRPFGCGCSAPQGREMPFDEARELFGELRKDMRYHIQMLAGAVHQEEHLLTIAYRELEHIRLDVEGSSPTRIYKAWLTKPSRRHPLGQVRADIWGATNMREAI